MFNLITTANALICGGSRQVTCRRTGAACLARRHYTDIQLGVSVCVCVCVTVCVLDMFAVVNCLHDTMMLMCDDDQRKKEAVVAAMLLLLSTVQQRLLDVTYVVETSNFSKTLESCCG